MTVNQLLLLGFFVPESGGRAMGAPKPDHARNPQLLLAAERFFGPLVDFRMQVVSEDEDRCPCSTFEEPDLFRLPYINQHGVLEFDLWGINGETDLISKIIAFARFTKCEIVRLIGFDSYFRSIEDILQDLEYYSGPQFRSVLEDWKRFGEKQAIERRLHVIPSNIQRRVTHFDVLGGGLIFPSSVSYWRCKCDAKEGWGERLTQESPVRIRKGDALAIDGDSNALISAPDGGIVHINGDIKSGLEFDGNHEVVLCGGVAKGATIKTSGISHIYIGGSVRGKIDLTGSSKIWIDGDFTGKLVAGGPSTNLHVLGDFSAEVSSTNGPAFFMLSVGGFALNASMVSIAALGFGRFHASIGRSDVPAGLYPECAYDRKTNRGNAFSRWCILSQGEAEPSVATERAW